MKGCQHVKLNCRGFNIGPTVLSATGFPLNFSVLQHGENNTKNYNRMVKFMFGYQFTCQATMPMALFGISLCSDRGYWTTPLILLLFGFGAIVFGTLCRMEWIPYTYDKVLKGKNKREKIMKKYCKMYLLLFVAQ